MRKRRGETEGVNLSFSCEVCCFLSFFIFALSFQLPPLLSSPQVPAMMSLIVFI